MVLWTRIYNNTPHLWYFYSPLSNTTTCHYKIKTTEPHHNANQNLPTTLLNNVAPNSKINETFSPQRLNLFEWWTKKHEPYTKTVLQNGFRWVGCRCRRLASTGFDPLHYRRCRRCVLDIAVVGRSNYHYLSNFSIASL